MSQSDTGGSSSNFDHLGGGEPAKEETESFWKQKVGGGMVGLWLLLTLVRVGLRQMDDANRNPVPRQAVQAPPDMARVSAIVQGAARHQLEQKVDRDLAASTAALRTNPNDANAYRTRAISWMSKGNYEKAIADFDGSIRVNPNDAESYRLRAVAWTGKDDFKKALADFDEAVRLKPTDARTLAGRGSLRHRQQEFEKAIVDYVAAIRIDPTNTFALNGLAWLYATCPEAKYRNGKKAIAGAAMACKLTNLTNPHFLGTLAAAYAETGDFDNATKCQFLADNMYSDADKQKWQHLRRLYDSGQAYRDEAKK